MTFIVEEINRSSKVLQRERFAPGTRVTVGRGLDNNLILNEPHVSPHHVAIEANDDGSFTILDLGSENGVRNVKRQTMPNQFNIQSGDVLLLGRTYVRIWDQQHSVEPTWTLHGIEDFFHSISQWWVLVLLLGFLVVGEWQLAELKTFSETSAGRVINDVLYKLLVVIGWASSWSLSGRVTRHESRFTAHLAISLLFAMLFLWTPWLVRIVSFNFGWGLWMTEINYFINGGLLSLLLWSNFYLTIPQKSRTRIIWSNGLAWGLIVILLIPKTIEKNRYHQAPNYDGSMLPPSIRFKSSVADNEFVESANQLYRVTSEKAKNGDEDDD